ncbi:MAG: hypothetical protein ACLQDL_07660 [Spirochaetia bacterium]
MERFRLALAVVLISAALPAFSLGSGSGHALEYLTLNPGDVVDLCPGPVRFGTHPVLLKPTGNEGEFRAAIPGHTHVRVDTGPQERMVVVFVTPTQSRQVGRWDVEWYRTQFEAGRADCGSALVSMSILWARGVDVPVRTVRAEIGYPYANGATRFDDLHQALARHRINSFMTRVTAVRDLVAVLERGHLALALLSSGKIARVQGDPRSLEGTTTTKAATTCC